MTILQSLDQPDIARGSAYGRPVVQNSGRSGDTGTAHRAVRTDLLAALQRFSALLHDDLDLAAIEKAAVGTLEQVFPAAMIACLEPEAHEGTAAGGMAPSVGGERCIRAPLIAGAETLGQLSLYFETRPALSGDEASFLAAVASQTALALRHARLAAQTRRQAVELRKLSDELTTSHSTKTEFLSVVSHEFRTPLNIIMGYAALMEEELVGTVGAEQRNCLEQIRTASHDLLHLVTSMLQAGSLEAGLVGVKIEEVSLDQLMAEVKKELRSKQRDAVQVIWDVPRALPTILTDAEKLKHVLHNLIDNAFKFTERGQVRISTKAVPDLRQLEIKVSDTGIGIAGDLLPLVFDRYRQLDGSISRAYEGLGLGLFIAKKLTDLLRGTLAVTSEFGRGSTFTIVLPLGV